MKMIARKRMIVSAAGILGLMMIGFQNCGRMAPVSVTEQSSLGDGAGGGSQYAGKGSISVPTADGLVARITNGLENNVSPTAGNFQKSLNALQNNLPQTPDPSKATGFDQAQLLVYAACTDLTAGGTNSKMAQTYRVPTTGSVATNKAALVSAGLRMFDTYVAGLASQPGTVDQVKSVLSGLVDTIGGTSTNTTITAFVSVCIAANTAGSTLMGF